ncbi:MAG: Mpo1-like protein [Rhodomicrobiaceae bacterium]
MSYQETKNNDVWYAYLRAHLDERTRNLHYAGTLLAIGLIFSAALTQEPLLIIVGLLTAYGLAWFGHFTIEKNQPAAFKRPVLSFLYNFKMLWLWLKGEVDAEFEAAIKAKEQV